MTDPRCPRCREDEHSECHSPTEYKGHPRGDDFEITQCCCAKQAA